MPRRGPAVFFFSRGCKCDRLIYSRHCIGRPKTHAIEADPSFVRALVPRLFFLRGISTIVSRSNARLAGTLYGLIVRNERNAPRVVIDCAFAMHGGNDMCNQRDEVVLAFFLPLSFFFFFFWKSIPRYPRQWRNKC
ncbi:hypothetical protein PUN28_006179 [Cardiocondyla obscurior]|uniref:Uncharacterized protein n=1 Tax=Cardiocondyla obscurior TaxID=286306 RepID=A0AAW2G9F7_9HYME